MTQYIFSTLFTVCLQAKITQKFRNRLIPMLMSVVVTSIGCIPMIFLNGNNDKYTVFPCAALLGVGIALMLNTGTSLISDVLGKDNKSAAFVYGAYSLADKFANGILLYWLVAAFSENVTALQWIMGIVPCVSSIGCAVATWLVLALYADKLAKISSGSLLRNVRKPDANAQDVVAERSKLLRQQEEADAS